LGPQSLPGRLLALAVVAWGVSQGIDLELNEPYGWTIVPEELLEMCGSTLFGLAMFVALRDAVGALPVVEHPAIVADPQPASLQPAS
jgi:hypothetical protein